MISSTFRKQTLLVRGMRESLLRRKDMMRLQDRVSTSFAETDLRETLGTLCARVMGKKLSAAVD